MHYANDMHNSPVMAEGRNVFFIRVLFFKENGMHIIACLFKGNMFANTVILQGCLGCVILLFSFVIFILSWVGVLYFVFFGDGIHSLVRIIIDV